MLLSEKIIYLRKKNLWSQEKLAEKIGVSRQAVSKWETGDSEPEISKLRLLAANFDVSIDWLLSSEDPIENKDQFFVSREESAEDVHTNDLPHEDWTDKLPKKLAVFAKRFGWLFGVYLIIVGLVIFSFGLLARNLFNNVMGEEPYTFEQEMFNDEFQLSDDSTEDLMRMNELFVKNNKHTSPSDIFTGAIMIFGLVVTFVGIVVTIYLLRVRNKYNTNNK